MLFALLALGCGKKPAPDASPTPEPNPSPGEPTPAGPPGIEGTYLIVGVEFLGEKQPDEETAKESELDRTVKISKDQIQFKITRRETVRYKLDPSKSPAEIDLLAEEPGKKSKANYGIYKVEGKTLTLFLMGAEEPQLRPREFKTLAPPKGGKDADRPVGGFMMLTLKKVSDDTTFISEVPPKPKPPAADEDGTVVAELTQKGFVAERLQYGKFPGVDVTVPSTLPLAAVKGLNGLPRVRTVTFKKKLFTDPDHPVTDEAIQGLTKLDGLTALDFESCLKITAGAFRDLSRFPMLTAVKVTASPVDDAVTEELAKVKTLERVELGGEKLTDKSLANLAKIKMLKTLWLHDAPATASGIKMLSTLPDLEFLALQGMPAADAALGELRLTKLEFLNLAQSGITDEGLGKLPVLPKLRNLTLSGPRLTDAGLKHLLKQPGLESVTLLDTKATKAGAEELKKLKPKLSISVIN
jgi:uncharacterized protein (TIGR03067 family)